MASERCDDEVADDSTVADVHPRTVGVEDASDSDFHSVILQGAAGEKKSADDGDLG